MLWTIMEGTGDNIHIATTSVTGDVTLQMQLSRVAIRLVNRADTTGEASENYFYTTI